MAPPPCTEPQEYTRARKSFSSLQRERLAAPCRAYLPKVLQGRPQVVKKQAIAASPEDAESIEALFPYTYRTPLVEFIAGGQEPAASRPLKVGVVLSGGQAPGGHNVIAGIFDGIRQHHEQSVMIGFVDGPHGVFTGNFVEITPEIMDGFRNTGGFDMLGSGRHKIESEDAFVNSLTVCNAIGLDGLVVIGGDDSNTNGAVLAEYFKAMGSKTKVVGAPKTIDGDLKCPPYLPVSFGFDSACKTYAAGTANVEVDALSGQKHYHFVRLMGRSASNIALEVALLTQPNVCLLGEEVSRDEKSLQDLTVELVETIVERSKAGKNYGVVILPEGLIEFIPEFNSLIGEINDKLADPDVEATEASVLAVLSPENRASFSFLPEFIREQLLLDRDPHGNVQVAKIETEKLLAATVAAELKKRRAAGTYQGHFAPHFHSFGYEGRAGMPTIFDASYCYALGATAAHLLANDCTGVVASVTNLLEPCAEWQCGGVPVTSLCVLERRHGKHKPVIKKALVELEGPMSQPYQAWCAIRDTLRLEDAYRNPGPTQYDMEGCEASREIPVTLQLELGKPQAPFVPNQAPTKMGIFLQHPLTVESRSPIQQWRMQRKHSVSALLSPFSASAVQVREGSRTTHSESEKHILGQHFSVLGAPLVDLVSVASDEHPGTLPPPATVGVVLCGRQAPGNHDMLCGLVDMLLPLPGSKVLGFAGGTKGLFGKHAMELTPEVCAAYRSTGGIELLGRTADQLRSPEQMENARKACEDLNLTGLVLVGGARTNEDAAYLAEYFRKEGSKTAVVGVPSGIEGSMVNEFVEASLGFDSSAKAMGGLVGNTEIDGSSARKYYYFIKMMDGSSTGGRTASSHVALEVALATKPNLLLLSEEVDARRMSLREVVCEVADVIAMRAADGKNFGTILVSEGLLGAIPEFRSLVKELEQIQMPCALDKVMLQLTSWTRAFFETMPEFIQEELLRLRHKYPQLSVSHLETEKLIALLVAEELKARKARGTFKGSYSPLWQYLGYQVRGSMPSNFDSDYGYMLGGTAASLAVHGRSGYMACVSGLAGPAEAWSAVGVPLTAMMSVPPASPAGSRRSPPSICPQSVDLKGPAWKAWEAMRMDCARGELYENPGPVQLSGKDADRLSSTIATRPSHIAELAELRRELDDVTERTLPGCDAAGVRIAIKSLDTLNRILDKAHRPA